VDASINKHLYTYRFRIYPNQSQRVLIAKHFGASRYLYNLFLTKRKKAYLDNKTTLSYCENARELTELKKSLPWLNEVGSQSLQYSLKCLDGAYNRFFSGLAHFPRYKSKHDQQSFRIPQRVMVKGNKLVIPKFLEGIRIVKHRDVDGNIRFATITRNKSGKYYVSLTVERMIAYLPETTNVIGVDLGIKTLATCSDGRVFDNIKPYRSLRRRMKMLQRRQSKKKKGSKNRERARYKLAKINQRIKNIRNNHLHQMTKKIISENQVVIMESLAVQNMMKNHKIAGAIADCAWRETNRQLGYKAIWYGRYIHYVNKWFPSSKTCETCGWINQCLRLKDRYWTCQGCGKIHDRDFNASKMILKQGLQEIRLERPEVKRMDSIKRMTDNSVS
jgi:putative transposase